MFSLLDLSFLHVQHSIHLLISCLFFSALIQQTVYFRDQIEDYLLQDDDENWNYRFSETQTCERKLPGFMIKNEGVTFLFSHGNTRVLVYTTDTHVLLLLFVEQESQKRPFLIVPHTSCLKLMDSSVSLLLVNSCRHPYNPIHYILDLVPGVL
jgi:hypothetical protein